MKPSEVEACAIFSMGIVAAPTCAHPSASLNQAAVEIGSVEAVVKRGEIDSTRGLGEGGRVVGDLQEPSTPSASLPGVGPRSDGRRETAGGKVERTRAGSGVAALFSLLAAFVCDSPTLRWCSKAAWKVNAKVSLGQWYCQG